jgi:hypothetical protein
VVGEINEQRAAAARAFEKGNYLLAEGLYEDAVGNIIFHHRYPNGVSGMSRSVGISPTKEASQ